MNEQASIIRVFIALELPAKAKQTLAEVIQKLRTELPNGVGWVNPSGIHLTLKFLGDIDSSSVAGILEAMRSAVKPTQESDSAYVCPAWAYSPIQNSRECYGPVSMATWLPSAPCRKGWTSPCPNSALPKSDDLSPLI